MTIELDVSELVRKSRLRWYGHVQRREESADIKRALKFEVGGKLGRGRRKMIWKDAVDKDMERYGMKDSDCTDRRKWRSNLRRVCKNRLPSSTGNNGD